jgi:SpoIID/LytB domain protein
VPVEDYLRGVVPRESPASWADAGGGRGAQALQAQAVAARSYSLSSQWTSYATTCDTTSCQVYGGTYQRSQSTGAVTSLEDRRSDAAISATAGLVRRTAGGAVARTEFSSSTGGWTAGGVYPAVEDKGDAVAANPNRSWSVLMSRATISSRLGVGEVRSLAVTRRNGLGPDGGRVLEVTARTATGDVVLTGGAVRSRLGLKSDWFSLSPFLDPAQFRPVVVAMWTDLLGRPPSEGDIAERTTQMATGRTPYSVAIEVTRSRERAQRVVVATYVSALGRSPSQAEMSGWLDEFQRYGSIPLIQAAVLGSDEAWSASGGDPREWVDRMYRTTLLRPAGPAERDYWAARLGSVGRYQVAAGIAGQPGGGVAAAAGLLPRAPRP